MATISFPAAAKIRSIRWELERPAQVHTSGYTGRRVVVADPWHGRWRATFELAPIVGQDNFLAWRAFMAALRGQINTFRLPATEKPQNGSGLVTVSGAAGATTITLGAAVAAGDFITVNNQMVVATTSGSSPTIEPALRVAASGSAEIGNPYCLVSMSDPRVGWSVEPGQLYGAAFSVEEAF